MAQIFRLCIRLQFCTMWRIAWYEDIAHNLRPFSIDRANRWTITIFWVHNPKFNPQMSCHCQCTLWKLPKSILPWGQSLIHSGKNTIIHPWHYPLAIVQFVLPSGSQKKAIFAPLHFRGHGHCWIHINKSCQCSSRTLPSTVFIHHSPIDPSWPLLMMMPTHLPLLVMKNQRMMIPHFQRIGKKREYGKWKKQGRQRSMLHLRTPSTLCRDTNAAPKEIPCKQGRKVTFNIIHSWRTTAVVKIFYKS